MQILRCLMTQATCGGRWVASRRNFSSSSVCKETTDEAVERVWTRVKSAVDIASWSFAIGYLLHRNEAERERDEIRKSKKEYLREVETLRRLNSKKKENSSELPIDSSRYVTNG